MKNSFNFIISKKEGIKFGLLSQDRNKIHTDKKTGDDSIFGTNICHGVLVLLKFFEIINIKKRIKQKEKFSISVNYKKHALYNSLISIKKSSHDNNSYILIQNLEVIVIININYNFWNNVELEKVTRFKRFKLNEKLYNYFIKSPIKPIIGLMLCNLTKYAGTFYPGKNSIIQNINIHFNLFKKDKNKTILIVSNLIDKRLPLIKNILTYKNYYINFETLLRPELEIIYKKPNKNILKLINSINENILIIGASSGIGKDLLNLFKFNKKIKIVSTYFKNSINLNNRNIIKKKIDIATDLSVIKKIIHDFSPLIIYYFPTPRINIYLKDNKLTDSYKKYYINYPLKIVNFSKNYPVKFFYPSTTYIDTRKSLIYSKIKLEGEKKLLKVKGKKLKINILRINEINTKQNLSLIKRDLPNFRDLLSKDKKIQKKIFFK